ncbi:MAG: tetratricopeptide repeat protein [Methylococcales bacterium]
MNYKNLILLVWLSFHFVAAFASCYDETRTGQDNFMQCRKAAQQGDSLAQYFVGQMYRKGEGVDKNREEALNWYRKAALKENRLAQYNLGWMYDIGDGIEKNPNEAISWYAKAARNRDRYAPFNIGALYFSGEELPRDPENALFWFQVALANGNESGRKWRDKIAAQLRPEQLEKIQQRFDAWIAETRK